MVQENNNDEKPYTFQPKTVPTATPEPIISGSDSYAIDEHVVVQADAANTSAVVIGSASVTMASGLQLAPGASMTFNVDDPQVLYCLASQAGQKLRIVGF